MTEFVAGRAKVHVVGGPPFIAHTGFFGNALVRERIVGWLGG